MRKYTLLFFPVLLMIACGQADTNNTETPTPTKTSTLAPNQKMDTAYFWKIMDDAFARGKFDYKLKEEVILGQLTTLTPQQIVDFEIIFQQMNLKANTWNNLAAQTIIEGGSSDDQFYYFRCWLISLGKKNFDETLKNPDHLASLDIPENQNNGPCCQFEELIPVSDRAYEIVTMKNPSTDTTFPRYIARSRGLFYDAGGDTKGTEWTSNEELPKIAPKLFAKFPGN